MKVKYCERYCTHCERKTFHTIHTPEFWSGSRWIWFIYIPARMMLGLFSFLADHFVPESDRTPAQLRSIVCESCGSHRPSPDRLGIVIAILILVIVLAGTTLPMFLRIINTP